ncbi:DUF302 domain-containing protein [Flaviaesturariibacter terrae]
MDYAINGEVALGFDEVIGRLKQRLQGEGFAVITEIDLREKFLEKLQTDFRRYTILGACNPKLAYEAIGFEPNIGVMLPCNIVVQDAPSGAVSIAAINPLASIGAVQNPALEAIAADVSSRLARVIAGL